ncbi:MAG: B12-binding domain-containing radical SAM protein [Deltaproteobacteria bacterium]|nr:B12-binding domain-containing radical SAM protein [Deltaproteobacteria bacterium]
MNIRILEHPRIPSEKRFNEIANTPLWSCLMAGYAAAALMEAGHDVSLLDAPSRHNEFGETVSDLLAHPPDALFVHAVYFWEHTGALFQCLSRVRDEGYGGHICLFGFFPTLAYPVLLMNNRVVDSIAVGEFEHTLVDLAERLRSGRQWQDVPGLAFRTPARIEMAARRPPAPDPDAFPFPIRFELPPSTASILAGRGCYNQCSFCPVPCFYSEGPLWRGRSVKNVIREVEDLTDRGFRDFYFVDANFVGPGTEGKERIIRLARRLEPLGVTFGMESRPNDLDSRLLETLRAAGLESLLMGIESGSTASLGRLRKGCSRETAEEAIALCRSFGIEPEVGFIMFEPDGTMEDLRANLDFLTKNRLLDRLGRTANVLCHRQIVLMGTPGYRQYQLSGRLEPRGYLGFEGEVTFLDPRVLWMSKVMRFCCLSVLKAMSEPMSPIYWEKEAPYSEPFQRVNAWLVELFERLLESAENTTSLPKLADLEGDIEGELQEKIRQDRCPLRQTR